MGYSQILKKGREILYLNDLPADVLNKEFPQLSLNSNDGKKVVLTFEDGQRVAIAKEQSDGTYSSDVYEFNSLNDELVWPSFPKLPDYLATLDLNSWDGNIDKDARDDYRSNMKDIQTTVNNIVNWMISQKDFFSKFSGSTDELKSMIIKIINVTVAQFLNDKYYDKSEIDNKLSTFNEAINNIASRQVNSSPGIGVFPPSYTGNGQQYSDDDLEVDRKLAEMNSELNKGGDI